MGIETKTLSVVVFIDGVQQDPNNFYPKEVVAIAKEIKKLWPDDFMKRFWFDVEYVRDLVSSWDVVFKVVCYASPGKNERHLIPKDTLDAMVNKRIRIYPYVPLVYDEFNKKFDNHVVEVIHTIP